MKKHFFLAIIALGSIAFGQNTFPSTGNAGIGTLSPADDLEIKNAFSFHDGGNKVIFIGAINSTGDQNSLQYGGEIRFEPTSGKLSLGVSASASSNPVTAFTLDKNGNIGIGITSPAHRFHVMGHASFNDPTVPLAGVKIESYGALEIASSTGNQTYIDFKGAYNLSSDFRGRFGYSDGFGFSFDRAGKYNIMVIKENDNVGIGTANPDEKLTVKGKIHAEEIKVDLSVPADYVFQKYFTGSSTLKPDYEMPSLNEIETFVKENHHLPSIPSAKEIQENGLELGEMNNLLLQKVEELTLYIIEQNKRIEALESKVVD